MFKNAAKFVGGGIAIVAVGIGVIFLIDYVRYQKSPEYRAIKEIQKIKKEIAEDPYGGDTPEETLRLFVDALKQGDTDLAAKYFVYDEQQQWGEDLAKIKDKGLLDEMVRDLEKRKEDIIDNSTARYFIVADDGQASPLVLVKSSNGRWKIRTL